MKLKGYIGSEEFDHDAFMAEFGGKNNLTVTINSYGGSVEIAKAMYAKVKEHKGLTTAIIEGVAASAASYVAMAFDKVVMQSGALMMIHSISASDMPTMNAQELKQYAEVLEKFDSALAAAYSEKTGKPKEEILQMMAKETWMTAEEAVAMGFADEIEGKAVASPTKSMAAKLEPLKLVALYEKTEPTPEKMEANIEALKAELEALKAENAALKADAEKEKKERAEALAATALAEGKIAEEAKASLVAFAANDFAGAQAMLAGIKTAPKPTVSMQNAAKQDGGDERADWTFADWRKNDPVGLEAMYNDDIEKFNKLKIK